MKATQKYNINEQNLRERRETVGLSLDAIDVLKRVSSWGESSADAVAKDFYRYQFSCVAPAAFFKKFAAENNVDIAQLRTRLEGAHAEHFRSIFQEARKADAFGLDYYETRLSIGQIHNRINLPLKLYLAAYIPFFKAAEKQLRRRYPFRVGLQRKVRQALMAVFNYEMQAVSDAFFVELLESLGIDTQRLNDGSFNEDLAERLGDLKDMMGAIITDLDLTSRALSVGSATLAETSADLAAQTQSQAAALQQTAATLVEVTESAESNSKKADLADGLTTKGGVDAKGIERKSVVETMSLLDSSSKKITNITGLIEEIAFQTNLLALNAAVEAARAGEHGRGFSIVAAEVGKLSNRATEAAQDIKSLIGVSVNNVQRGVQSVNSVADMVQQISSGSREQSVAISEITRAINSVDAATQVNAGQAEKLSDLADALRQNAAKVQEITEMFKKTS